MKTMNKILFVLLFSAALTSCKKSGGDAIATSGNMNAKIDGSAWSASLAVQATSTSGVLSVGGTGTGGQINLTIGSYTGPKTYAVGAAGGPGTSAMYTLTSAPFTSHSATFVLGSGTIVVTSESSGFVEGTFSFDGKNNSGPAVTTKVITEGSFKAKLQ